MTVFGANYAAAYDALYTDKDYEAECDLIERVVTAHASAPVRRVLDLGCGTGAHAAILAARGYEVVGVDRSEEMLAVARGKAGGSVTFRQADIRTVELGERFDLVLMMFAVIGYLGSNEDVIAGLAAARRHVHPNGLLVLDAWYEPAVLSQLPSERVKEIDLPGRHIQRRSTGVLDPENRRCTVRFHVIEETDGEARAFEEEHVMRYFSKAELTTLLAEAGFELARLTGFADPTRDPDETTWTVLAVSRAEA